MANRLMKDNIIMIAFKGFAIYKELAKGLRNHFKGYVKSNLKNFLSKLNSR